MSRTLIVTGGSRGIGRAIVGLAARRGWNVCFSYVSNAAQADALVAELGGTVRAVRADSASEADTEALFAACMSAFGPPDGLVIAAGIAGPSKPLVEQTADEIDRVLAVNLRGPLLSCREMARAAQAHPGPARAIVTIGSVAMRTGGLAGPVYPASKGGVASMTLGMAREMAALNIRVTCLNPGLIDTDMTTSVSNDGTATLVDRIPLRRMGRPEEIAEATLFLLSDAASYITGTLLDVSGGR